MDIFSYKIGIAGLGKVGSNLTLWIKNSGMKMPGVFSRSGKKSDILKDSIVYPSVNELVLNSDVIFITTPDGIIADIADEISSTFIDLSGKIFLHCSGSLPSTIMKPLLEKGAETGSIHPLQSFSSLMTKDNPFNGIIMAVEGSEKALEFGIELAKKLGAKPFSIKTDAKTLYHAAAVVSSNYLVTLFDIALSILEASGIDKDSGVDVLLPLVKGTIANIVENGTEKSLTGPVSRGDSGVILSHIDKIKKITPEFEDFYFVMLKNTIDLAFRGGHINEDKTSELKKILL